MFVSKFYLCFIPFSEIHICCCVTLLASILIMSSLAKIEFFHPVINRTHGSKGKDSENSHTELQRIKLNFSKENRYLNDTIVHSD